MELIQLVGKIYQGGHVGHPKVRFVRCKRISATADIPVAFHLDGDVAGNLPVTFEIKPSALNIIIP